MIVGAKLSSSPPHKNNHMFTLMASHLPSLLDTCFSAYSLVKVCMYSVSAVLKPQARYCGQAAAVAAAVAAVIVAAVRTHTCPA
jgi:hypothetical protein